MGAADELVTWKRQTSIELATRPVSEGGADLASLWYTGVTAAVKQLEASGVAIALCTSNLQPITAAVLDAGGVSIKVYKF